MEEGDSRLSWSDKERGKPSAWTTCVSSSDEHSEPQSCSNLS